MLFALLANRPNSSDQLKKKKLLKKIKKNEGPVEAAEKVYNDYCK